MDGTPYAVKVACTVWSGGKARDNVKGLPITISRLYETETKVFISKICQYPK